MTRQVVLSQDLTVNQQMQLLRTLGGRIALKRHEHRITQQSLAGTLHVSQTLVSQWERNVVKPTRDTIDDLAEALRTTRAYLLTDPIVAPAEAVA